MWNFMIQVLMAKPREENYYNYQGLILERWYFKYFLSIILLHLYNNPIRINPIIIYIFFSFLGIEAARD